MRRFALVFAAASLAAGSAAAVQTWYWNGAVSCQSYYGGSSTRYGYAVLSSDNWINASTGQKGVPGNGDLVVFDSSKGKMESLGDDSAKIAFGGFTYVTACNSNQGCITLQPGETGVQLLADGTVYWNSEVSIKGTGELPVHVAYANVQLQVQKNLKGDVGTTLVKTGPGTISVFHNGWYSRTYTVPKTKLQGGTFRIGQYEGNVSTGHEFWFDSNDPGIKLQLFYKRDGKDDYGPERYNWVIRNGALRESAAVQNHDHQINSSHTNLLVFTGTPKVSPMTFTGRLTGNAGLKWNPATSSEFVFSGGQSTSSGKLIVSNGTVRVTDGASFPALSSVLVDGANSRFAVEATASGDYSAVPFVLANGAALSLADGTRLCVKSVTVDGVPLVEGTYSGVSWIAGGGCVVVGGRRAVWNGSGAATTLANWQGASSLPPLDSGVTYVDVVGGTSLVADVDVALDGVSVGATPFALSAAAGRELRLGATGLTNGVTGVLTVGGGGGDVVVAADQDWNLGDTALTFGGNVRSSGSAVYLDSSKSPSFAGGVRIGCDLWFVRGATLTCPRGEDLTFDGLVSATNSKAMSVTAPEGSTITFNKLMMSRGGGTLGGAGRIVFNDSMHFRDRPNMTGTVTVELHKGGNRLNGNMGTFSGGTLKAMAPYVITWSNTVRQAKSSAGQDADGGQNTMINAKGAFTLDLNGFDQSIDIVAMHADGTAEGGCVTSATPATLHLMTSASYWPQHNYSYGFSDYKSISTANSYGYETMDKGRWTGAVNISYEAAAGKVRSMMRVSSSTGRVEVVSGRLVFVRRARTAGETFDLKGGTTNPYPRLADEDGAWPLATAVAVKGGTLKLEHSLAFGRDVDVALSSGGTLELDEGVVCCCRSLTIDGVWQQAGRFYDAQTTSQIAGAGRLYVRGGAPSATVSVR